MRWKTLAVIGIAILIFTGILGTTAQAQDEEPFSDVLWVIDGDDHSQMDSGEVIPPSNIIVWHSFERIDIIYRDAQNESEIHYEREGTRVEMHQFRAREDAELIIRDHETGDEIFYQYHLEDTFTNRFMQFTGIEEYPTLFSNFLAFLAGLIIIGVEFYKLEKEVL